MTFDKQKVVDPDSKTGTSSKYPVVMVINLGLKVGF